MSVYRLYLIAVADPDDINRATVLGDKAAVVSGDLTLYQLADWLEIFHEADLPPLNDHTWNFIYKPASDYERSQQDVRTPDSPAALPHG